MGVTKRAPESKDIRAHEQQPRNVRRFKRTGEAAPQIERAALRAKFVEAHDLQMREKTAASLVTRVEHRALEAHLRELAEESEIGLFVSEYHADERDVAREPAQTTAQPIERRRIHGELDIVYADRTPRSRAFEQRFFIVRRIAERRARFATSRDGDDRLAHGVERDGSKRAPARVLQIDDVGAKLHDHAGLGSVGHTGEHARHRVVSHSPRSPKARSTQAPAPNGAKSDGTHELQQLDWPQTQSYHCPQEETQMHASARAVLAIAIVVLFTPQAVAQFKGKTDPDWPCQQIKTPTFSLASVWAGPQLDLDSETWRDESDVADLKVRMAQRRVPIVDVESAIADFKAKAGPDANAKLLRAFGAAFTDLAQQRSQIIDGLDRIGRKQKALADRIRAENEAMQNSSDQNHDSQAPPGADSQERLLWDLRVFDDRRQTVTYVCEAPTLIEQRIGEIARAVQKAL